MAFLNKSVLHVLCVLFITSTFVGVVAPMDGADGGVPVHTVRDATAVPPLKTLLEGMDFTPDTQVGIVIGFKKDADDTVVGVHTATGPLHALYATQPKDVQTYLERYKEVEDVLRRGGITQSLRSHMPFDSIVDYRLDGGPYFKASLGMAIQMGSGQAIFNTVRDEVYERRFVAAVNGADLTDFVRRGGFNLDSKVTVPDLEGGTRTGTIRGFINDEKLDLLISGLQLIERRDASTTAPPAPEPAPGPAPFVAPPAALPEPSDALVPFTGKERQLAGRDTDSLMKRFLRGEAANELTAIEIAPRPFLRRAWDWFLGRVSHDDTTWALGRELGLSDGRKRFDEKMQAQARALLVAEKKALMARIKALHPDKLGDQVNAATANALQTLNARKDAIDQLIARWDNGAAKLYELGGDTRKLQSRRIPAAGEKVRLREGEDPHVFDGQTSLTAGMEAFKWIGFSHDDLDRKALEEKITAIEEDPDLGPVFKFWGNAPVSCREVTGYTRYTDGSSVEHGPIHEGTFLELHDKFKAMHYQDYDQFARFKRTMKADKRWRQATPYIVTSLTAFITAIILAIRHTNYWQAIYRRLVNVVNALSTAQRDEGMALSRERVAELVKARGDNETRDEVVDLFHRLITNLNEFGEGKVLIGSVLTYWYMKQGGTITKIEISSQDLMDDEMQEIKDDFKAIQNIWAADKSIRSKLAHPFRWLWKKLTQKSKKPAAHTAPEVSAPAPVSA